MQSWALGEGISRWKRWKPSLFLFFCRSALQICKQGSGMWVKTPPSTVTSHIGVPVQASVAPILPAKWRAMAYRLGALLSPGGTCLGFRLRRTFRESATGEKISVSHSPLLCLLNKQFETNIQILKSPFTFIKTFQWPTISLWQMFCVLSRVRCAILKLGGIFSNGSI